MELLPLRPALMRGTLALLVLLSALLVGSSRGFQHQGLAASATMTRGTAAAATAAEAPQASRSPRLFALRGAEGDVEAAVAAASTRRRVLTGIASFAGIASLSSGAAAANAEEEGSYASIAERARQISKDMDKDETLAVQNTRTSDKTAYDFTLPIEGKQVPFKDAIRQEISEEAGGAKVKAVLVVNIKQDDPVARKTVPELIALAAKYGGPRGSTSGGALAVVACPTDQGYYEPDTSALIRLKLASEYGYGINPATVVTDKMNLLGSGAHPFWRWLESTCRTPAGLGRIEGTLMRACAVRRRDSGVLNSNRLGEDHETLELLSS